MGSGSDCSPEEQRLRTLRHDAANWLTVVLGHLELLASEPDGAVRRARAQRARRALERVRDLADRMVHLDRPAPRTAHLPTIVREIAEHARAMTGPQRAIDLRTEVGGDVWAAIDPGALSDALVNLVRNAILALGDSGRIDLVVDASAGDSVRLTVLDDGPGMDDEVRSRCLEVGFSTRSRSGGQGLGLARVAATVRAVGGEIEIRSAPGRGTSVVLTLPLAAEPGSDGAIPAAEGGLEPRLEPGPAARILLVEDEEEVAEVTVALLASLGHTVDRCDTAAAAEAQFVPGAYDLLLLDQNLPDGRGEELAAQLRKVDPAVVTILISGDPAMLDGDPVGCLDRVALKPLGREQLLDLTRGARALVRRRRSGGTLRSERAGAE